MIGNGGLDMWTGQRGETGDRARWRDQESRLLKNGVRKRVRQNGHERENGNYW